MAKPTDAEQAARDKESKDTLRYIAETANAATAAAAKRELDKRSK